MIAALLASIVVSSNCVSFTAVSTDCGLDAQIEFLFAGPDSDHDYESMFLTEDSVKDIAAAFEKAGMPLGKPALAKVCKFWPIGTKVKMEPDLWSLVRDMRDERKQPIVWTGGTREPDGAPVAATNMPLAVFALYNLPQSLMQFDDALDQSATYGRFQPAVKIPKGEKRTFKFTWSGETNGGKHEMTPDFPPEQFFYRAFLPRESWRDRKERLSQPFEVRFVDGKPSLTVIKEDWSDPNATDPKLIETHPSFESVAKDEMTDTCFIYAPKSMKLADVYAVCKLFPKTVVNWYVFGE